MNQSIERIDQSSMKGKRTPYIKKCNKCKQCDKSYSQKCKLLNHERAVHNKELLECNECDKKFSYLDNLRQHYKIIHKGIQQIRKLKCDLCTKTFVSPFESTQGKPRKCQKVHM